MPSFTIEVSYHLPVCRRGAYRAATSAAACSLAIEDQDWATCRVAHDAAGERYVSAIWAGADAALSRKSIPVPSQFEEGIQRKAGHFEILLGLLKMLVTDVLSGHPTPANWVARTSLAIARAEAIIAGKSDPDAADDQPGPSHALAWLHEDRVRDRIAAILENNSDFAGVVPEMVTDQDLRAACLAVARARDLAEETGAAESRAAYAALGGALRHLRDR